MKYLLAFLVLSVIIFVHEFGHFIVAKASGVTVTEFSLGMGPRLLKFKKNGTLYSIKLFFFGGSCRMLGEDEDDDAEGSFNKQSVWRRIAIVAAGPIFNFILAFVLSIILLGKIGYDPVVIYSVEDNTPVADAGLIAGDQITRINGHHITFYGDYALYSYEHDGEVMDITYIRDGEKYTTKLIPEYVDEDVYQMGVYMGTEAADITSVTADTPADKAGLKAGDVIVSINGTPIASTDEVSPVVQACEGNAIDVEVNRDGEVLTFSFIPEKVHSTYYKTGLVISAARVKLSPIKTVGYAFREVGYYVKYVFTSLKLLFTGHVSVNDMSGPVGIVSTIGEVVEQSRSDGALYVFLNLVNWTIMISANLGVMNLLPIPALDGGRLVFLVIEAVRRKPVPRDKEGMIHFVGIVLLMILMVFIMFNDIRKLF